MISNLLLKLLCVYVGIESVEFEWRVRLIVCDPDWWSIDQRIVARPECNNATSISYLNATMYSIRTNGWMTNCRNSWKLTTVSSDRVQIILVRIPLKYIQYYK